MYTLMCNEQRTMVPESYHCAVVMSADTVLTCSTIGRSPSPRTGDTCTILVFFANGVACNVLRMQQPQASSSKRRPTCMLCLPCSRTLGCQRFHQCGDPVPIDEPLTLVRCPTSKTARQLCPHRWQTPRLYPLLAVLVRHATKQMIP